jgi:hypothetical protein
VSAFHRSLRPPWARRWISFNKSSEEKQAASSKWVTWEWKTAFEKKGTRQMEIHPLQPAKEAPPPPELAHLSFGDRYQHERAKPFFID